MNDAMTSGLDLLLTIRRDLYARAERASGAERDRLLRAAKTYDRPISRML